MSLKSENAAKVGRFRIHIYIYLYTFIYLKVRKVVWRTSRVPRRGFAYEARRHSVDFQADDHSHSKNMHEDFCPKNFRVCSSDIPICYHMLNKGGVSCKLRDRLNRLKFLGITNPI
jgi:hypothetical protein